MNNTDKTRRVLMNSMVKTRAGARTKPASAERASPKPVARKKTATRKKATVKKVPIQKKPAGKLKVKPQLVADPYQSKGRIWPD